MPAQATIATLRTGGKGSLRAMLGTSLGRYAPGNTHTMRATMTVALMTPPIAARSAPLKPLSWTCCHRNGSSRPMMRKAKPLRM